LSQSNDAGFGIITFLKDLVIQKDLPDSMPETWSSLCPRVAASLGGRLAASLRGRLDQAFFDIFICL